MSRFYRNRGLTFDTLEPRDYLTSQLVVDLDPYEQGSVLWSSRFEEHGDRLYFQTFDGKLVSTNLQGQDLRETEIDVLDEVQELDSAGDYLYARTQHRFSHVEKVWRTTGNNPFVPYAGDIPLVEVAGRQLPAQEGDFVLSDFGTHVYYSNNSTEFWWWNGSDEPELLLQDPSGIESAVAENGMYVAVLEDSEVVVHFHSPELGLTTTRTGIATSSISDLQVLGTKLIIKTRRELLSWDVETRTVEQLTSSKIGRPPETEPRLSSSSCKPPLVAADKLFFVAQNQVSDHALWVSDGTVEGTQMVFDPIAGGIEQTNSPSFCRIGTVNGTFLFDVANAQGKRQTWRSDGTEAGTEVVADFDLSGNVVIGSREVVDEIMYFFGHLPNGGWPEGNTEQKDVWRSDGTKDGTFRLIDLNGEGSSSHPKELVSVRDKLYFVAHDGSTSRSKHAQLWVLDNATEQVVRLVDQVAPDSFESFAFNNSYFFVSDGSLWKADAQSGIEVLVENVANSQVAVTDDFIFVLQWGEEGMQDLYSSDGTIAGTRKLAETTALRFQTVLNVVTYQDRSGQYYQSDGTPEGTTAGRTQEVVDALNRTNLPFEFDATKWRPRSEAGGMARRLYSLSTLDGARHRLFSVEKDSGEATELGESAEFMELLDYAESEDGVSFFVAYYRDQESNEHHKLWRSDGTESGTWPVDVGAGVKVTGPDIEFIGENLYFAGTDGTTGGELRKLSSSQVRPEDVKVVGDIDGDGRVAFADFLVLSQNFGLATPNGDSDGDLDLSGVVDFADFLLLSQNFGKPT